MKATSPRCDKCRGVYGKAIDSGADADGNRLRWRVCQSCNHKFTTVEITVPGIPFYRLDVERKAYQKEWTRKTRGYRGQPPRKYPVTERLIIEIKVIRGVFANTILKLAGHGNEATPPARPPVIAFDSGERVA